MLPRRLSSLSRTFLEDPLFSADTRCRGALKCGRVDALLQDRFREQGSLLQSDCCVEPVDPAKWLVIDATGEYVIRDQWQCLSVARRKHPRLSRMLIRAERLVHVVPTRIRQICACEVAAIRKRVVEHPPRTMVNLGAGRWYARHWKVLDHQGIWYHYPPLFVDFDHDLTSAEPLPFADRSVHRFYSEHVFEHFPDRSCARVFAELRRCLARDGGLRIVVPDTALIWERFGTRDETFFGPWMRQHNASLTEAFLILVGHPRTPFDEDDVAERHARLPRAVFLDQCCNGLEFDPRRAGEHVNWFDADKLARMLRTAGFANVVRTAGQQSRFPEMRGRPFDKRAWYSLHMDAW